MLWSVIAILLFAATARAADPPGSAVTERRATVAGELTITRLGDNWATGPYRIALGDRLVMQTDNESPVKDMPIARILADFRDGLAPYDEIVVLEQGMAGNACNGGPIWFLGLNKSGAFTIIEPIDFCGGPSAKITRKGRRITLTFPGGPPNHGSGWLPTAVWVFEAGAARQIK